jgi:glycosyltransferase involved in cell wall biosynthesis
MPAVPSPTETAPRRAPGIVIAWMAVSRRSDTIATRLGLDRLLLGRSGFRRPWTAPLAYPLLAARSIGAIARRRPRAIVVVAPPFLAPLVVMPLARLLRARVAIDIHTGALLDRRWRWSVPLLAWACRRADAAIVTLPSLADNLRKRGIAPLVIPDPLPDLAASAPRRRTAGDEAREVVAVCGWGDDEPIEALVDAARGRSWQLVLTGRPRRPVSLPPNVHLTGFLDDVSYVQRLGRAAAVVVLTTREDTLLSGAWEAISLGRPLVLSHTAALRETFGAGPAYVAPEPGSIAAGIEATLADPDRARAATRALRKKFGAANDAALAMLHQRLVSPRPAAGR